MAKKKQVYFSICLNEEAVKKYNLTPEEIKKLSERYITLDEDNFKRAGLPVDLVLLKGQKGEIACVRDDSDYKHKNKFSLILKFPLSLTITEQRDWISYASKFFKPLIISQREAITTNGTFTRIKGKPYGEFGYEMFEPTSPRKVTCYKVRHKSYADSAPYGSKTARKRDLQARNKWIRKRYKKLKKDKTLSKHYDRYSKIADELVGKHFGNLKITTSLAVYTIKNIIYSKPKKISD